jgi:hypothetical protein
MPAPLELEPRVAAVGVEHASCFGDRRASVHRLALDQRDVQRVVGKVRQADHDAVDLVDRVSVKVPNAVAPERDHPLGDPFRDRARHGRRVPALR